MSSSTQYNIEISSSTQYKNKPIQKNYFRDLKRELTMKDCLWNLYTQLGNWNWCPLTAVDIKKYYIEFIRVNNIVVARDPCSCWAGRRRYRYSWVASRTPASTASTSTRPAARQITAQRLGRISTRTTRDTEDRTTKNGGASFATVSCDPFPSFLFHASFPFLLSFSMLLQCQLRVCCSRYIQGDSDVILFLPFPCLLIFAAIL